MVDESDGIGEHFDSQLRVAMTVAAQYGQQIARLREQWSRAREARALDEHKALALRFEGERAAARAQLALVDQPGWWDQAQPRDVAEVYETAVIWRDYDEAAEPAIETIRENLHDRYDVNLDDLQADPNAVATALAEADAERSAARQQRALEAEELTAAELAMATAEQLERDAEKWDGIDFNGGDADGEDWRDAQEFYGYQSDLEQAGADVDAAAFARANADFAYDSAERRSAFAHSLEGHADKATVTARVLADTDQAQHPRAAVGATTKAKTTAKVAKTQTRVRGEQELQR
jgi:hypothetical protein